MRPLSVVDEVITHSEDGDAFLLHVPSGKYFGLNQSGLIVWNALVAGVDPLGALSQRWPAQPRERLQADADTLIDRLVQAGLVAIADGPI